MTMLVMDVLRVRASEGLVLVHLSAFRIVIFSSANLRKREREMEHEYLF